VRLLHVNHRYSPFQGGSELYVQQVAERFAAQGHDVRVLTSDAWDLEYFWNPGRHRVESPASEVINGVVVRRVPVSHVPAPWFIFNASRRGMAEAVRLPLPIALFEAIARYQPLMPGLKAALAEAAPYDLAVATNLSLEGPAVWTRDQARRDDIPFVLIPFIHLGLSGDDATRRYVSMPHQRALLRDATAVLTMTAMEATFANSLGVDWWRLHVVGAGVNPEDVTGGCGNRFRERHGIEGGLVGCLGAMAPGKGTVQLVSAVVELRRQGHDIELALAGPELESFTRWYTGLDARDRAGIHLLGVIDANEKRDLLDAIDLLAMPSRTESFGIVYLEAWANRKPVVAAHAGAVTELVRDGENGLMVEFGNVDQLADAIRQLMRDRASAERLGRTGYELVEGNYTWERVFERVAAAYGSVLGVRVRTERK
jgi:glycogen synthase